MMVIHPSRAVRFAVIASLSSLLLVGCDSESDQAEASAPPPAIAVNYVLAKSRIVEEVEHAVATLNAKWSPQIAAEVSGLLDHVAFDAGDEVEKGAILAKIEATDYEIDLRRAEAQVRRLETLTEQQEREIVRQRKLREQGHISAAALEDAEAELSAQRQELEVARSDLGAARKSLDRTVMRAPREGVIAARLVSEGDYVEAGQVLFHVTRGSLLQVQIPLPETLASRLEPGLRVRLASAAMPDRPIEETVSQIAPEIGTSSRAVTLIAEVHNPGLWQVGSSVNAEVILDERRNVVLPVESLVRRPAGTVVYILDGGIAQERAVVTGERTSDWVEILEGVEPGEAVIADGAGFLSDGTAVRAEPRPGATGATSLRRGSAVHRG